MTDNFTSNSECDTVDLELNLLEEEEMPPRYHFANTIYLYGVFEEFTAQQIIANNTATMPLKLYESPKTAYIASKNNNVQKPTILRFAVNTPLDEFAYDEFIEESRDRVKKSKMTQQQYENKCKYLRKYNSKEKRIVYTIKNSSVIVSVQFV